MALPLTLRRTANSSALRDGDGDALRGAGGAEVVTEVLAHIIAYPPARAGPPGSVEYR